MIGGAASGQPPVPGAVVVTSPSQPLSDGTVSVGLALDPGEPAWQVTVLLSRRPNLRRVEADELAVRLVDGTGSRLAALSKPSGQLVEAGGGLGVTANAEFRFDGSGEPPSRVEVEYRGESVSFEVVPAAAKTAPDGEADDGL